MSRRGKHPFDRWDAAVLGLSFMLLAFLAASIVALAEKVLP